MEWERGIKFYSLYNRELNICAGFIYWQPSLLLLSWWDPRIDKVHIRFITQALKDKSSALP